jgi:hypothetical protein
MLMFLHQYEKITTKVPAHFFINKVVFFYFYNPKNKKISTLFIKISHAFFIIGEGDKDIKQKFLFSSP